MIQKIIRFSAENRYLVIAATLVALVIAVWTMGRIPLDALPDLSDTQVIVYSRWDRSPDILEDQVTYPIITSLLGAPKVKAIRGFSDFGYSYVYVVFQDGTDIYWARTRVLEYLSKISSRLPAGVKTELGPDATSLGWVFQYALVDSSGKHSTDELRSYQDWFLRYAVQSVPGVSEVATVGGQVRQYQITVNPASLAAYGLPLDAVVEAVRHGNNDVGGRLVELSGREYMIRGRGYVKSMQDLEKIVLKTANGTPIQVKDVATVALGPEMRRGIADYNGQGDVVGGIVVMRQGENALGVIERVKAKLAELRPSLPPGVKVVTTYDRSELIGRAVHTVKGKIIEEIIIVSLVILLFLWHIPSATVPILTIPVSVALAFIPMYLMGLNVNLLSMAGIAISIGVLVDGAIIEVENAYNKIYRWQAGGKKEDFHKVRLEALLEVGPSVFFSLLVIAVAFLPVFTLVDQEGRLFKPLAFSKNFAMAIAAILAITFNPAMRMLFARSEPFTFKPRWLAWLGTQCFVGRYYSEERHPISRLLHRAYETPCRFVVRHAKATILASVLLVVSAVPVYLSLGSEFMPPMREGSLLYMPSATQPGMSVAEAQKVLQVQDKILLTFPEVSRIFGKAGRADTPTDPAPFSMMETTILLKPESQWREKPRWYSSWAPEWLKRPLRPFWRDRITEEQLVDEMDAALHLPGISNAWTMPIKARLDMLSTGIRTPVGIKVSGADLQVIQKTVIDIESALQKVAGTRSVYAERVAGGYFLDYVLDRDQLARYGLSVDDANMMVMTAVGGDNQTTTVEGRARYGVNVRYARDYREDLEALKRVLLPLPGGKGQIPMSEIADVRLVEGPSMIRDENGLLSGYVYVDFDVSKTDVGRYVERAKQAVAAGVKLPTGYAVTWSGQYENMLRVKERLKFIVPLTLLLIFGLLFMNTKSAFKSSIVMLAVPFSMVGAIWLLFLLHYNISIAVWVGMIALAGLDAETGVFMLLFLDLSHDEAKARGHLRTSGDLVEAIIHGAVKRVRPKAMTVAAAFMGLLPIMWSTETGSDLMKRIAAPMVGGLVTSFALELLVYPAIYYLWRRKEVNEGPASPEWSSSTRDSTFEMQMPPPAGVFGAPAVASSGAQPPSVVAVYTCPMHTQIRAAGPGSCPTCGMGPCPGAIRQTANSRDHHPRWPGFTTKPEPAVKRRDAMLPVKPLHRPSRAHIPPMFALLLFVVAIAGCSSHSSHPMAPAAPLLHVSPVDGASGVRLDAPLVIDFGTSVDRPTVESGLHLLSESDMLGACPDSTMGSHGTMDAIMGDSSVLRHMDQSHATRGSFSWNAGGTVCTFAPDSLMRPQTRYMVHMSGAMVEMMQGTGGMMGTGRMNGAGDMMMHFQTMTSDGHDGHH